MQDRAMNNQPKDGKPENKDVELTLTVRGGRDSIMDLLDKMNRVDGFAVLKGSFTVKSDGK
jgi:hypothetical protein